MKKGIAFFLMLVLVTMVVVVGATAAQEQIKLLVNDTPVDTATLVKDGRVFVPIRSITEILGVKVTWNSTKRAVVIDNHDTDSNYLKGFNGNGIRSNLVTARDLASVLDDDSDGDFCDYRAGHNGGDLITNDPLVIDIRAKQDYDASHIPNAVWVAEAENLATKANLQTIKEMLREHTARGGKEEIVLYCYTGNTSGLVCGVLGSKGFPVRNLMYGYDIAWTGTRKVPPPLKDPGLEKIDEPVKKEKSCGG